MFTRSLRALAPVAGLLSLALVSAACENPDVTFSAADVLGTHEAEAGPMLSLWSTYKVGTEVRRPVAISAIGSLDITKMTLGYDAAAGALTINLTDDTLTGGSLIFVPTEMVVATNADYDVVPFNDAATNLTEINVTAPFSGVTVEAGNGCERLTSAVLNVTITKYDVDFKLVQTMEYRDYANYDTGTPIETCRDVLTEQEALLRDPSVAADSLLETFHANSALDIDRLPQLKTFGLDIPVAAFIDSAPVASSSAALRVSEAPAAELVVLTNDEGAYIETSADAGLLSL